LAQRGPEISWYRIGFTTIYSDRDETRKSGEKNHTKSEGNNGTSSITYKNVEFLDVDINLEFVIRVKIISCNNPIVFSLYISFLWDLDIISTILAI